VEKPNNFRLLNAVVLPIRLRTSLAILFSLGALLLSAIFTSALTQAFTVEDFVAPVVTATIPIWDTTPPTTPILISPSNGSFLNYTPPTFVWQASTDAFEVDNPEYGMDHYVFFLDGNDLFGQLPLVSTETPNYSLVYDPGLQQYSLTPKFNINDGAHTWKVQAFDYFDNYSESVTWTFTIDTQAPNFVLNEIGDESVSISAQDPNTIPDEPIILTENRPLLVAVGEGSSDVQLTVIIPNQSNQTYNTTINSDGSWELELPLLPRDVVIGLSFIITDQAGNVSVLETVEFIIETPVIIIPIPTLPPAASPTPTPSPSPSPSPSPQPGDPSPEPTPSPSPSPSPQVPGIVIPILPPEEIAHQIIKEVADFVPLELADVVQNLPDFVTRPIRESTPYAGILVSAFVPALAAIAVASQFGGQLSLLVLLRLLQALGLLPKGAPQGIVFDSATHEPIAFALVSVYRIVQNKAELVETVVSNVDGIYSGVELPAGTYQVVVSHLDFDFPSTKERPKTVSVLDFYRGEQFELKNEQNQIILLIPMDAKEPGKTLKTSRRIRIRLAKLARFSSYLTLPLFLLSGLFAVIFPSIWNTLVFICYCALMSRHVLAWFKTPIITGVVVETNTGTPIPQAVIRLSMPSENNKVTILQSNEQGEFRYFGKPDTYLVNIYHQDYAWIAEDHSPLSLHEVHTQEGSTHIVATMQAYKGMYQELFT
jgi:5-hydroxyisourate hydrolase-like protein (transthyretin family)